MMPQRLRRFGPPALAFAAARALMLLAALWGGQRLSDPNLWMRWDSWHYRAIAEHGYEIHPCAAGEGVPGAPWCGDAGWFPGYPALIRAGAAAGVSLETGGSVISALAALLSLMLLWNGFLIGRPGGGESLMLAAVFPGAIYQQAYFPMSLCVCGLLGIVLAVRRERAVPAALVAAATATMHPVAAMLAPAAFIAALMAAPGARRRACGAAALGIAAGLGLVVLVQHAALNVWDGWARVQEMSLYHGWTAVRWRQMLYIPIVMHPTAATKALVVSQSLLVALLVLGAAAIAGAPGGDEGGDRMERTFLTAALMILWLAPHLSGYRQSYYRSECLLLPLTIMAPRWPRAARWGALAASAMIALLMAGEYFAGRLV